MATSKLDTLFNMMESDPLDTLQRYPEFLQYIPQYDEQLLGPAVNFLIQEPFEKPNYVKLETYNCEDCQLKWLVGFKGPTNAESHPSHHTLSQKNTAQTKRSLIVHICGTCVLPPEVPSHKSSMAVYFAPFSRYNISKRLHSPILTDTSVAKVAATAALKKVRTEICPRREEEIHTMPRFQVNITSQDDGWTTPPSETALNVWRFRLLVATDSWPLIEFVWGKSRWYVNNNMSKNRAPQRHDSVEPVTNEAIDEELLEELDLLARLGIQVQWYCVEREDNQDAVSLALNQIGVFRSREPPKVPAAAPGTVKASEGSKDAESSKYAESSKIVEGLMGSEKPEALQA
jgi:hypothetical protein